jgi:SAM-dependent methyltransferase
MNRPIQIMSILMALGVLGTTQFTTAQPTPTPTPTTNPIPARPDVPYVPTPEVVVNAMLEVANVVPGDVVYDLGSGDGRLVIGAVQRYGATRGVGVEINPGLVKQSTENARNAGVGNRVQFLQQDLFQTDLQPASVVTLYLLPDINLRLRPKLLSLKPGTRIVSHAFSMGDWQPDQTVLVSSGSERIVYFWVVPANIAGTWQGTVTINRPQPFAFEFSQKFQQVQGSVIVDKQKYPITKLKLVGDRLSFNQTQAVRGQQVRLQFDGRIEGNTLKGTAQLDLGGFSQRYPVFAKRTQSLANPTLKP